MIHVDILLFDVDILLFDGCQPNYSIKFSHHNIINLTKKKMLIYKKKYISRETWHLQLVDH